MGPIAISNTRPGFVPFSTRPLAIVGQAPRPQYRQAFVPAPYRPPMLANPAPAPSPSMDGFSMADVPLSLTLGIAGAGAMILAGVVPSPVKEISTVLGLGLIGFGLLNLFSAPAAAETSVPASGAKPFTTPTTDQFNRVSAKIIKPVLGAEVNRGLFSKDYDVEILWTNGSTDKTVTVPYRIFVEEEPVKGVIAGGLFAENFKGIAYTGVVTLGPGQSLPVPLEIDLQHRAFIEALAVSVKLTVQKVAPSGQVFDADTRSFVVY